MPEELAEVRAAISSRIAQTRARAQRMPVEHRVELQARERLLVGARRVLECEHGARVEAMPSPEEEAAQEEAAQKDAREMYGPFGAAALQAADDAMLREVDLHKRLRRPVSGRKVLRAALKAQDGGTDA